MKTPISQKTKRNNEKAFDVYFNANNKHKQDMIIELKVPLMSEDDIAILNEDLNRVVYNHTGVMCESKLLNKNEIAISLESAKNTYHKYLNDRTIQLTNLGCSTFDEFKIKVGVYYTEGMKDEIIKLAALDFVKNIFETKSKDNE